MTSHPHSMGSGYGSQCFSEFAQIQIHYLGTFIEEVRSGVGLCPQKLVSVQSSEYMSIKHIGVDLLDKISLCTL